MADLARILVDHGVNHAFGVTGSGPTWALITDLERLGVDYHPVAHEAAAAIMAGAVARSSGRLAVSISIRGPGLGNMLPGILHNHYENLPALSVSEAMGRTVPSFRKHKRLDQSQVLTQVVKRFLTLNRIDDDLSDAIASARREVPGPIHLDLRDDLRDERDQRSHEAPASPGMSRERELVHVERAERPVLVVGSLASRRSWKRRLADLRVPVFTTAAAKGVLDEGLPQAAGVFTGDGKQLAPESKLFERADLVVGMGLRNTEVLSAKPFGRPTVILDEIAGDYADGFSPETVCTSDDESLFHLVFDSISTKSWGLDEVEQSVQELRHEVLSPDWSPARCFEALNRWDRDHALVVDTGSFCTVGEHVWRSGAERPYWGSSNGRFMGVGLPTAIGASFVDRSRPLVCITGDGGIRPYAVECRPAARERLPIMVVLMSDGRYGSIASTDRTGARSSNAIRIFESSWRDTFAAWGWDVASARSSAAFEDLLRDWTGSSPIYIETVFDQHCYAEMTRGLR